MTTPTWYANHTAASPERSAPTDEALQHRFRTVMASVATPVSVITAMADGVPRGTTVSAFASLSMTPPMVVVCLDRNSDLLTMLRETRYFGVNVLSTVHTDLALTFARKGGAAKFTDVGWATDHGLPRLPGTGWLACRVTDLVEGGDHILALGTVLAADTLPGEPLTYHDRIFGTHTPLQASA